VSAPRAWGRYHGQWGFDTFSKLKPVFRQSRINGMALFLPPYRVFEHHEADPPTGGVSPEPTLNDRRWSPRRSNPRDTSRPTP
jgi:hypothetical protein